MEKKEARLPGLFRPRDAALAGILVGLLLVPPFGAASYGAQDKKRSKQVHLSRAFKGRLPIRELSEEEAVLHALNRLGFGPRPGEVERARKMGLERWMEKQLNPESMDEPALAARLARFPTLAMSPAKLLEEFPNPAMAARRMGMTPEEYLKQRQQMARPAGDPPASASALAGRWEENRTPQRVTAELSMAKLMRAIYSERQLKEVMVDFWFNHFNVFAGKGADRWVLTSYEQDVIRPHALGRFRDLLQATARSPAMLFYLDNWMSADPKALARMPGGQAPPQMRRRGLNENYARELMELHTLGVEGGYTQQDVTEVARCFTGWTLRAARFNPEFVFEQRLHDNAPKTVLGRRIHAGGMKDGEEVLDMLTRHPSTARFISTKLARRLVADDPPPALVDRMARTFLETDGDIRALLP